MPSTTEQTAQIVADQIRALWELTAKTGTKTTRTQNEILQSIPDHILLKVALLLKERV